MGCGCTRLFAPLLALMLINWSMTCSRGHAMFHDEEQRIADSDHAPHHHGPFEHTEHTAPGDTEHQIHKPTANRQPTTWRAQLSQVLQSVPQQAAPTSLPDIASATAEGRPGPVAVRPIPGDGRQVIRTTQRWRA